MLAQIQAEEPEEIRLVYRHFPLISIHDKAALSAQAADAAGAQDKFWEMHELLFDRFTEWKDLPLAEFQTWIVDQAATLELDKDQFEKDLTSDEIVQKVQNAWDHNSSIGLPGTPFILINGRIWPNDLPMSKDNILAVIDLERLEERQFTSCPPMAVDPAKEYVATLHMEKGDIVVELFAEQAPIAVNNFIFLSRQGWYDGVTFHRVLSGFVAQGGDPTGTGFGGPGYAFVNETSPDLKFDKPGLLAMANAGPDSNGSQFFITFAPLPNLDGGYTIFGQVIEGMEVAEQITQRDPTQGGDLPPGDEILGIDIEEK